MLSYVTTLIKKARRPGVILPSSIRLPDDVVGTSSLSKEKGIQPPVRACYHGAVIRNLTAYDRLCEQEQWDVLRARSIDDSIAVLEALLTSELMDIAAFADDDQPMSLARSLGIPPDRIHRVA